MQKLLLLFFLTLSLSLNATLPEGAIAVDWTMDDINGLAHDLYGDYLDQGYSVVMDMSATWCGPCWTFHQSGTMEDVWDDYGPNGAEGYMIMPMMIEADPSTNQACLFGPAGCNSTTLGDWSAGIPYPIFNPPSSQASDINNDYNVTAFPTMYVVAPSGYVKPFVGSGTSYNDIVNWGAFSFQMENSTWTVGGDPCGLASIDLHPNQGYGNISFEWSSGETTEDLQDLDDGDYYVTLTDDNGYEAVIGPIEVEGTPPMEIDDFMVTDVDCYNNTTGAIEVDASGGVGSFDYDWSNGDSGSSITDLFADTYDVTITDNSTGCEIYETYIVFEPDEIEVVYEIENAPCGSSMGSIEFDNEGGVYPFEYIINGTTYYNDEIALPADSYSADIIDANGCMESASFTIAQQAAPVAMSSATGSLDCSSTPVFVDGTGSATGSNITYSWTDANGTNIGNSISVQVFNAGNYTLSVNDTDSGCSSTSAVTVSTNTTTPASAANSSNNLTCNLPTSTLSGAGSATGPGITYLWSTTDGNITGGTTGINATANAAGTYNLLVTDTNNGCISNSTVTITQSGLPSIAMSGNTSFCSGSSTNLCVPIASGETIQWIQNGTVVGTSSCYSTSASSTYEVILTNSTSGCSVSQTIQTTANALPSAAFTGDTQFCSGGSTTLCYAPLTGITYQWVVNGTASAQTGCLTIDNSATVSLNVTNSITGCGSSQSATITETSLPTASIAPASNIDCTNNTSTLNLTTSAVGATFAWYDQAGLLISNMEDITVSQAGTYTAYVSDMNGCQTQSSVSVIADTNLPQISIDAPASLNCTTTSTNINLNVNNPNYTINWYNSAGTLIGSTEDITVNAADTYTVHVSNAAGCETQSSVVVTADTSLPTVSIATPANIGCNTTSVILDASISNGNTVTWTDANGNSLGSSEDITVTAAGTYNVSVSNAAGCATSSSVTVLENTDYPTVSVATPANLDCNNSSVVLNATTNGTSISWTDANGNAVGSSPAITVTNAGTYTVAVSNAAGCLSQTSVTVSEINNSIADAGFSFANNEFVFNFTDETVGETNSFVWNFGDGNFSTEASPMHTYDTPGYYNVCLEAVNECGSSSHCMEVLAVGAFVNDITVTNVSCFGMKDGTAAVTTTGGLSDYDYAWSDSSLSGPSVTGLAPGNDYSVVISDQVGNSETIVFSVDEPAELTATATITNTVSSAANGQIDLQILGGTGAYDITWSDGGDGTNLNQGDYSVTIRDENDCTVTQNFTVEGTSSIDEIDGLLTYSVSPNPATQFLNVTASFDQSLDVDLNIITMLGERQHLTSSVGKTFNEQVDISNLAQGVYLIELRSANQIAIKRVIVAK